MIWLIVLQWFFFIFIVILFICCVLVRIIRRYYHFPIPSVLTRLIDNPIRRRFIQNPQVFAERLELQPGMIVVEIGPGKGSYTIAIADRVGPDGKVYAVDISENVVNRLKQRISKEHISNIFPKIENAHHFSFADESVDRVVAIACLAEIPEPVKVLHDIYRILKPNGLLSISELAPDPDYPRRKTVKRWADDAGFVLYNEYGNWFVYQLNFQKSMPSKV